MTIKTSKGILIESVIKLAEPDHLLVLYDFIQNL